MCVCVCEWETRGSMESSFFSQYWCCHRGLHSLYLVWIAVCVQPNKIIQQWSMMMTKNMLLLYAIIKQWQRWIKFGHYDSINWIFGHNMCMCELLSPVGFCVCLCVASRLSSLEYNYHTSESRQLCYWINICTQMREREPKTISIVAM